MVPDFTDKERVYTEIYYVDPRTGTAHTVIGCALGSHPSGGVGNIEKVPKEDAIVEIDKYCGSCCYKAKEDD